MRKGGPSRAARTWLCIGALIFSTWATGATSPSADQAKLQALQKQLDELNEKLNRLKSARALSAQQEAMQNHWSTMQDYMRSMRQMPGMGARGRSDWMMMDPGTMGMMGPGMMNRPMMGHGMSGWAMPSTVTPNAYQQQMQERMQKMRSQMTAIAAETDPTKRQALMREQYESMYRDMQTMRGMGWMWTPNAAASLPEANSRGAQLVSKYCSQCHAPPPPSLHTQEEWVGVTQRMRGHMGDQAASGSGVLIPNAADLNVLTDYLGKHGRAEP